MACRKMNEDFAYARNTESGCNFQFISVARMIEVEAARCWYIVRIKWQMWLINWLFLFSVPDRLYSRPVLTSTTDHWCPVRSLLLPCQPGRRLFTCLRAVLCSWVGTSLLAKRPEETIKVSSSVCLVIIIRSRNLDDTSCAFQLKRDTQTKE